MQTPSLTRWPRSYVVEGLLPLLALTGVAVLAVHQSLYTAALAAMALAAVAVCFLFVEVGFLALVFLLPFDLLVTNVMVRLDLKDPSLWKEALTLVVAASIATRALLDGRWRWRSLDTAVSLYLAAISIRLLLDGISRTALSGFKLSAQMLIFYFIGAFLIDSARRSDRLLKVIALSGAAVVALVWCRRLFGAENLAPILGGAVTRKTLLIGGVARENGLFASAYNLGFFLAVLIWIAMVNARPGHGRTRWRFISIVLGLASLAPFIYTYSRSAWVALLGALVLGGILLRRLALPLSVLIVSPLFFLLGPVVHERFTTIASHNPRLWLWRYHLENTLPAGPFFGIGLGKLQGPKTGYVVDNLYLHMLLECGAVGFALLLSVLGIALYDMTSALRRAAPESRPFAEVALGVFLLGVFISLFGAGFQNFPTGNYFWLFVGAGARLSREGAERSSAPGDVL